MDEADREPLDRGAIILALADEIERRCPRGRRIAMSCRVGREVRVSVPSAARLARQRSRAPIRARVWQTAAGETRQARHASEADDTQRQP